jgi:hypothetical protein
MSPKDGMSAHGARIERVRAAVSAHFKVECVSDAMGLDDKVLISANLSENEQLVMEEILALVGDDDRPHCRFIDWKRC